MRALLEEYGHTLIVLIIASVMLVGVVLGTILPQMGDYSESVLPKDTPANAWDITVFRENFYRPVPSIIAAPSMTIVSGTLLSFDDCIANKTFAAVNADGVDVSQWIKVTPADANAQRLFAADSNYFGGPNLTPGEYNFVLSVADRVGTQHFGKVAQQHFKIIVVDAIA